jgi:hypothetical protein
MTVKTLDPHIKQAFTDLGFDEETIKKGCWLLERNEKPIAWICLHKFLERVAQVAGITFDEPKVFNLEDKEIAIYVNGHKGDFSAWAIGEASSKNCKNDYRWAMAEKRAKDRVILKLIGIAGDVYSEEEADEFKKPERQAEAFEKQATAEKRAKTAAFKKGEDAPKNPLSLDDRYNNCLAWLKIQTPESFLKETGSRKDSVNALLKDLQEKGCQMWYETLNREYERVTDLGDSLPDFLQGEPKQDYRI